MSTGIRFITIGKNMLTVLVGWSCLALRAESEVAQQSVPCMAIFSTCIADKAVGLKLLWLLSASRLLSRGFSLLPAFKDSKVYSGIVSSLDQDESGTLIIVNVQMKWIGGFWVEREWAEVSYLVLFFLCLWYEVEHLMQLLQSLNFLIFLYFACTLI